MIPKCPECEGEHWVLVVGSFVAYNVTPNPTRAVVSEEESNDVYCNNPDCRHHADEELAKSVATFWLEGSKEQTEEMN